MRTGDKVFGSHIANMSNQNTCKTTTIIDMRWDERYYMSAKTERGVRLRGNRKWWRKKEETEQAAAALPSPSKTAPTAHRMWNAPKQKLFILYLPPRCIIYTLVQSNKTLKSSFSPLTFSDKLSEENRIDFKWNRCAQFELLISAWAHWTT